MDPRDVFQVEIRTRDLRKAMSFYGAIFDWKIQPSAPDYALIDSGQMPVISIFETRDPRFPLGIADNVLVEDCQKEGDRAVALGGRICVRKFVVPNQGAYVGTFDPWGNELFFWEPFTTGRPHLKGSKKNPVILLEIATPDLAAATKYYSTLLGWSFWGVVFADNYAFAERCGLARGVGLFGTKADQAHGTTNYVAVANLAETLAKVRAAGGRIVTEPSQFPGEGKFFVFEDLEGNRMGALEQSS